MPLIPITRQGFTYWEAPRNRNAKPLESSPAPNARATPQATPEPPPKRKAKWPRPPGPPKTDRQKTVPHGIPDDIAEIQELTMRTFGVTERDFFGRSRPDWLGHARIASATLCKRWTTRRTSEIAAAHNRDHSNVSHAAKRFKQLYQERPAFRQRVKTIRQIFRLKDQ